MAESLSQKIRCHFLGFRKIPEQIFDTAKKIKNVTGNKFIPFFGSPE